MKRQYTTEMQIFDAKFIQLLMSLGWDYNFIVKFTDEADQEKKYELIFELYKAEYITKDTAMEWFASSNKIDKIKILITEGANVNAKSGYDFTPIFSVVICNNFALFKVFLEAGAELRVKDRSGQSLLFYAEDDILEFLIQNKFDVNESNCEGDTPIFSACRSGKIEKLNSLIRAGADFLHCNKRGVTALDVAIVYGRDECIKILEGSMIKREHIEAEEISLSFMGEGNITEDNN